MSIFANWHVNILFQASGSTTTQLSKTLSKDSIAVLLLVPEKFNFVLKNDKDGTMRPWLSGDFTNTLKKKDDRSYFDLTEDEWTAQGHYETGHSEQVADFTIRLDPATQKLYNDFSFVKNGKQRIGISSEAVMGSKESIEYGINIIDHTMEPMQQSIIVIRQLQQVLLKLNGLLAEQEQ